jgi:hypothetical protein
MAEMMMWPDGFRIVNTFWSSTACTAADLLVEGLKPLASVPPSSGFRLHDFAAIGRAVESNHAKG